MGLKNWLNSWANAMSPGNAPVLNNSTIELPVQRVSVEICKPFTPNSVEARFRFLNPRYPKEWLPILEKAVIANPDLSFVFFIMIALANTGHQVIVTGKDAKAATDELNMLASVLNTDSLVNQLFAQIALYGCISAEIVVNPDLSGIKKIVRVPYSTVWFAYDIPTDTYQPYQWVGLLEPIPLNMKTYIHDPMLTIDGSPYAIPPLLAALGPVEVQEEFMAELKNWAHKIGLLGLLDVAVDDLQKSPTETYKEYLQRLADYLDKVTESIAKNIPKGLVTHFKNTTITHKDITTNSAGLKELLDTVSRWVASGAKTQPSLLGLTTGRTETWATVAYQQFVSQLKNSQNMVKRTLETAYKMHLVLKEIDVDDVKIKFNPLPSLDPQKDAQEKEAHAAAASSLKQNGIIDTNEARQMMGFQPLTEDLPNEDLPEQE